MGCGFTVQPWRNVPRALHEYPQVKTLITGVFCYNIQMRYKVEKKPSNTKGDTWTSSTIRTIYREEFNRHIPNKRAKQLASFLALFWEALRNERTYLTDVNIWDLSHEKRREIFLRGYQMWIMYETQIDRTL